MRRCAWLGLLLGPLSSALRVPSYEEEFPSDCPESGVLNLNGRYKVTRQINVTRVCHLIALPGTEIRLHEQIFFQADATFSGSWTFIGVDHVGAQGRCLDVEGEARFLNATAHFTNCGGPSTEDGGGLYAEKSLLVQESQLEFRECEAIVGGSIFVQRGLYLSKSHLSVLDSKAEEFGGGIHVARFDVDDRSAAAFRNCVAGRGGGGGILVYNGTMISDGHISLTHCVSTEGGGIALLGSRAHLLQRQGSIEVRQSRSRSAQGGCIHVDNNFEQLADGVVILDGCATAMGTGGGLSTHELNQHGTLQITNATALDGGAIFVEKTARITGRIMTRNTTANAYGGSIRAEMMLLLSGELRIRDSRTHYGGGALHLTSMKVAGGVVDIQNSSAVESGGAIYVALLFTQSGGRVIIQDAGARWGGAIRSFWFGQKAGSITIRRCYSEVPDLAAGMGGGLNLLGGLFQGREGVMHFEDVWTTRNGGAIASIFIVSRGNITFKDVYARDEGGAVFLHKYQTRVGPKQKRFKETLEKLTEDVVEYTLGGRATRDYGVYRSDYLALGESRHVFQNCKASLGGAIHAAGAVRMKGHVEFRDVMATTVRGGAAVSSHLMSVDRPVTIINASVPDGGVFCMQRAFRASMMTFINATAPQIQCASRLRIIDVSVTGTTASLMAPQRKIQRLTCDNGLEGYLDRMETGCHRCRPGFFQLQGGPEIRNDNQVTGHNCIQAPMGSEQIDQILQIRPGFMVARSNLSTSLRCPNVMACPGGQLMADQGVRDMCEHGYEGHDDHHHLDGNRTCSHPRDSDHHCSLSGVDGGSSASGVQGAERGLKSLRRPWEAETPCRSSIAEYSSESLKVG